MISRYLSRTLIAFRSRKSPQFVLSLKKKKMSWRLNAAIDCTCSDQVVYNANYLKFCDRSSTFVLERKKR